MCIVSIVELENQTIFTHSRDEAYIRPFSDDFETKIINNNTIFCPTDLHSHGTWICVSDELVCCLLNGAFEKHLREFSYRMSRGLLLFEIFKFHSVENFFNEIDLHSIEPFTMILLNVKSNKKQQFVWDGNSKHLIEINNRLFVRSSSSLYSKIENENNKNYFSKIENYQATPNDIIDIHNDLKLNIGDKNPFVKTVCISQIIISKTEIEKKIIKL